MKNKKYVVAGVAMGLAGLLIISTAFASVGGSEGYQAMKAFIRNYQPIQVNSVTLDLKLNVQDAGKNVLDVVGTLKTQHDDQQTSGTFTAQGQGINKTVSVFKQNNETYMQIAGDKNIYQLNGADKSEQMGMRRRITSFRTDYQRDESSSNIAELLLDTVMGDLKNQVTMTQKGDNKTYALTIDQNNMPPLMKAILGVAFAMPDSHVKISQKTVFHNAQLEALFPEFNNLDNVIDLQKQINLQKISFSFTVDKNNQPIAANVGMDVSGIGADGQTHDYTVAGTLEMRDLNQTTPAILGLTGKHIEIIECKQSMEYGEE